MKLLRSNIGFIIAMLLLALIAFNPGAKAFLLQGLIKTGLYKPDFEEIKESTGSEPAVFRSGTGELTDLANTRGKVIFVNFWADWCPPCIAEMPAINELAKHFRNEQDLLFMMVNADGDLEKSEAFFNRKGFVLPSYIPAGSIPESMFGGTLPTTLIIDKNGEIVYRHEGLADYSRKASKDFIRELLSE